MPLKIQTLLWVLLEDEYNNLISDRLSEEEDCLHCQDRRKAWKAISEMSMYWQITPANELGFMTLIWCYCKGADRKKKHWRAQTQQTETRIWGQEKSLCVICDKGWVIVISGIDNILQASSKSRTGSQQLASKPYAFHVYPHNSSLPAFPIITPLSHQSWTHLCTLPPVKPVSLLWNKSDVWLFLKDFYSNYDYIWGRKTLFLIEKIHWSMDWGVIEEQTRGYQSIELTY